MLLSNAIVAIATTTSLWALYKLCQIGKREAGLPPGPPTIPLLGNLHVFPTIRIHYKFTDWAKKYGDIYSLKIGSATAVVITSVAAVREILDRNSAATSDRPASHMMDLITDGKYLALARYHGEWRKLRRGAHEILTPQACNKHLPVQHAEATQLMHDILTHPEDFFSAVQRYSLSVILSVVFGKRAPQISTHEAVAWCHYLHYLEQVLEPGAQLPVDLIPVLKMVPERFASWKTLCKKVRTLQRKLYFGLLDEVENRVARSEGNGCFMETLSERAAEWSLDRESVGYIGGVLLDGASDTTSSFIQSLILALVAFPEVQEKAQEEIDRVIGPDRTPTVDDLKQLPYVQAVIKENHRFRTVAPLAVPHATTGDVMYKGYLIPAGSVLFINSWGMYHDENVYENEAVFNPDRYMKTKYGTREDITINEKDWKEDMEFGTGRRLCPGIHLAKNSLAINAVNLLWAFDFKKAKDTKTGADIEPDPWDYALGLGVGPNPFKCTITPRTAQHAEIIERQFAEATALFVQYEHNLSEEDRKFVRDQRKAQ